VGIGQVDNPFQNPRRIVTIHQIADKTVEVGLVGRQVVQNGVQRNAVAMNIGDQPNTRDALSPLALMSNIR
jgi:hypothetical protein